MYINSLLNGGKNEKMKKILCIVFILLILTLTIGYSQPIYYGDQVTVAWDEVTTYEGGDPIEPDSSVSYQVYLQHRDTLAISQIIEVEVPTATFTYDRGVYIVGVSSIITLPDEQKIENPDITWSTMMDIVRVPDPFFVAFTEVAATIEGLIIIQ